MIITSTLVHTDLHHSMIKPLAFVWPHVEHLPDPHGLFKGRQKSQSDLENKASSDPDHSSSHLSSSSSSSRPRSTINYYWAMLMRFIFEGTENNMLFDAGIKRFPKRLAWTALQGVGLGVVVGFPCWCLFIVILGPIYGMGDMGNRWDPQVSTSQSSEVWQGLKDGSRLRYWPSWTLWTDHQVRVRVLARDHYQSDHRHASSRLAGRAQPPRTTDRRKGEGKECGGIVRLGTPGSPGDEYRDTSDSITTATTFHAHDPVF